MKLWAVGMKEESKSPFSFSDLISTYNECVDQMVPHIERLRKVAREYKISVRVETNSKGEIDIALVRSI